MKRTNKIQQLQKRSEVALGVFRSTVANLASINQAIEVEQDNRKATIVTLEQEVSTLEAQRAENSKFIGKINEFLGVDES